MQAGQKVTNVMGGLNRVIMYSRFLKGKLIAFGG